MQATRIVVISPSAALAANLARQLPASRFEIVDVRPGSQLVGAVRRDRAGIAVIDRIDHRPEAAQLEIALLKETWPDVEIIALSLHSSERDAPVIEQGIFYYAAGDEPDKVVRLILAAEAVIGRKQQHV